MTAPLRRDGSATVAASNGGAWALPERFHDGRYRTLRQLGSGASKRVVVAYDEELEREVAVAVIRSADLSDGERARLLREVRVTAQLCSHPNILTVHDAGEQGEFTYVVLELVEGGSVAGRLSTHPSGLPLALALRIARDVTEALAFAHSNGVIHRDVKPSNVLLTSADTALLADFGVMRMHGASELTATGDLVGTPLYMAPEQIESSVADAPADLYAVGVMLFAMVCGRTPFVGDPVAVLWQHVQTAPPDPRTLAPSLPDAVAELILRLLSKDPRDRPSAAAVVAALEELAPDSQRPVALPLRRQRCRRRCRRRRSARSSAAAARSPRCAATGRARSAGGPGLSLLAGEPGIGKSRLAAALAESVHQDHALVLYGSCDEEPLTSYQPFVQALRHLLTIRPALELDTSLMPELVELGRLVPELRRRLPTDLEPGKPQRYLLFEAVVSLLAAAKGTPLLLVIDDLQWADESTLHLLRHVLDDPARAVTMVVATTRPEALQPPHPLVAALDRVRRSVAGVGLPAPRARGPRRRGDGRARRHARASSRSTPSSSAACARPPPATRSSSRRRCAA